MLTLFEAAYLLYEPFLPVLYGKVRKDIDGLLRDSKMGPSRVLDVGGRKSPYTTGLSAEITLLDIPRRSETQHLMDLGLTTQMLAELKRRRSNVTGLILEDMNQCTLPSNSFDGVVCVEVLEHIPTPALFLGQIARVLKPGGWCYLTTPNGDYIRNEPPNYNPDHYHHYTRKELIELLSGFFCVDRLVYGVSTGKYRVAGLHSFNPWRPIRTIQSIIGNVINRIESRSLETRSRRTAHLIALVHKPHE